MMRYKKFGNTDLNVSAFSVGTWELGGAFWAETDREESIAAVRTMVEQGATTIDTAPIYGFGSPSLPDFGYGNAEVLVGEAVKGMRDKVQIITKCGLNYDRAVGPKSMYKSMTRKEIIEGCEGSLRRLQTDYIDVLFIHWPDNKTPLEEMTGALRELQEAGKIRYYGLSNFTPEDTLAAHAMLPVSAVQLQYSMVNRSYEDVLRRMHDAGIGTMTYGSLGSGILTGAIRELPNFAPNDTRVSFYDYFKEPKFSRIMELLKQMDKIAEQRGVPLAQIALNWSTQHDFVDTAICGVSKPAQALENCAAASWTLTDEEMAFLNDAVEQYA